LNRRKNMFEWRRASFFETSSKRSKAEGKISNAKKINNESRITSTKYGHATRNLSEGTTREKPPTGFLSPLIHQKSARSHKLITYRLIGFRQRKAFEFSLSHPPILMTSEGLRSSLLQFTSVTKEQNGISVISMVDDLQDFPHLHPDIELLQELPPQTSLGILIQFHLPPGKLPQGTPVVLPGPFGHQNPAIPDNDPSGNDSELVHICNCVSLLCTLSSRAT